ncbi:MAG: hypothetical protein ACKVOK_03545 [Flavobacteriales bacterium]
MKYIIYFFLCLTFCVSCKKEPGIGGDASIAGQVIVRDYNSTFTELIGEYPAEDVYVYLSFGGDEGFDKRLKTDYKGEFKFDFLYKGDYSIYVYSDDSTLTDLNNMVPVVLPVKINERKEEVVLDPIVIFN